MEYRIGSDERDVRSSANRGVFSALLAPQATIWLSRLAGQRLERRTHNGNPTVVNIGVPGVCNELPVGSFPSFPIIPSLATQKQRKWVRCSYFRIGNFCNLKFRKSSANLSWLSTQNLPIPSFVRRLFRQCGRSQPSCLLDSDT